MYTFLGFHFRRLFLFMWPLSFLLRIKVFPKSITTENFQQRVEDKTVVYILPRMSILDIFVLNNALKKLKQPLIKTEATAKATWKNAILALKSPISFFQTNDKEIFNRQILNLLESDNKDRKLLFFPVSIYWSRASERNEKGFLLKSFFPDDGTGNFLQKLFMLLLHRGEVNVSFGKEIEIYFPQKNGEDTTTEEVNSNLDSLFANRLRRQLFIEFAKERTAFLGPVLYDQEKITQWILASQQTKNFLLHSEQPEKTKQKITKYIREIAANYHYATMRAVEQVFDFIWTKVFTGIRARNFEKIERITKDNCVIWMCSHRSHFDYLLLNYLLFKQGAMPPHVAAGINMNFWPVGPFVRHGGAFFIRRSFSGNKTYTHTFSEYVNFLLHNSYPIEFFPEGGRSRIGKLLPPKLGMLSICVQSVMQRKAENTYLMPVSIGYDKVMEDDTYAKELKGSKKQKENVWQFLNGVRKVFANYGSVDVSFGTPIFIAQAWNDFIKKFENDTGQPFAIQQFSDIPDNIDSRDPTIQSFVKYLAYRVHQKINGAATASSTALLSTVLLTHKEKTILPHKLILDMLILHYTINELGRQLKWEISTSKRVDNVFEFISPYLNQMSKSSEQVVPTHEYEAVSQLGNEYIQMGKKWLLLLENKDNDKLLYVKNPDKEFNLWWYRGTTFHIFAIMGVLSRTIISHQTFKIATLEFIFETIRKLWRDELFWDDDTSNLQFIEAGLNILSNLKVLSFDGQNIKVENAHSAAQNLKLIKQNPILQFYAETIRPEIELYGLFISVALYFIAKKRFFERNELLEKAFNVHEIAYKQNATPHSSTFVKVFGNSIFDALSRQNIFITTERRRLTVDMILISGISEFFDVKKWKKFLS